MNGTIGEIRLFAGDYAPVNWAFCQGQVLPINANQPLFSIMGNRFGGDGVVNFALPDFRGRVPVGAGQGIALSACYLGKTGGVETVTISVSNMPTHNHHISGTVTMPCYAGVGDSDLPTDKYPARFTGRSMYKITDNNFYMSGMQFSLDTDQKGLSQAVSIIQPVLGLTYIICIAGLFPERP